MHRSDENHRLSFVPIVAQRHPGSVAFVDHDAVHRCRPFRATEREVDLFTQGFIVTAVHRVPDTVEHGLRIVLEAPI